MDKQTIVVIGNGMVGQRFLEKIVEFDTAKKFRLVTFCEEPRAAYDRVGLTSFFAHRNAEKLMLSRMEWYREQGIELHIGHRAAKLDCEKRLVTSDKGLAVQYDVAVMATGSYPFVPPIPGVQKVGVFVYRTIEDLERLIEYGKHSKRAAVIGGGLLGLEAAKAAVDLGLETVVVEAATRLMPRQIDEAGSRILVSKIEQLGVKVIIGKPPKEILGDGKVSGISFGDEPPLDCDMIIVSTGIRPRDDLAKESGIRVGERGGVIVDDLLRTSDPYVFAIGEVALHRSFIYGLVAPGYEMAEIVAANLCAGAVGIDASNPKRERGGALHETSDSSPCEASALADASGYMGGIEPRTFTGADLSTKLKLMGVDVASFGQYELKPDVSQSVVFEDPVAGVYKRLLVSPDGTKLLGGILVGDASDYTQWASWAKSGKALPMAPGALLAGEKHAGAGGAAQLDDECQVCSCNNVTKGQLCTKIRENSLSTIGEVKSCTKAGTGCGGCVPLVTELLKIELARAGKSLSNHLCEHFPFSRQELFQIVKINGIKTFDDAVRSHGKGLGCEICKPAVASMLASLWNENIQSHQTLQDTNDRFLANIQRGGLYSVIPRVAGGEITPEKLIVLGQVAKKYGLYTKITGGQRIDLFGARVHQLPSIWEELIEAGFESGHAYGKALRTVKSCVGSTWCRYGVGDSVGFAIRIENRYKGLRAPHKIKSAVSGCIRECAEAQCKDFGLIATDKGYNLYVCGNGGVTPRHADLLAADLDEETAIKYIDRFLMYYIQTADRLQRTAPWLESMDGGIAYLRSVIIDDKLGICAELERQLQAFVDTYECEWKVAVTDPAKRRWFQQFANSDDTETGIEIISERGQTRPADWPKEFVPLAEVTLPDGSRWTDQRDEVTSTSERRWVQVGYVDDFPMDGGRTVKYGRSQLAVFRFDSRGEWYASQNMCPHRRAFVLSQGLIGDQAGVPKVSCPLHKKNFSLETGQCLSGEVDDLLVFPVKVERGEVYLELPPPEVLDAALATELFKDPCSGSCTACGSDEDAPGAVVTEQSEEALAFSV